MALIFVYSRQVGRSLGVSLPTVVTSQNCDKRDAHTKVRVKTTTVKINSENEFSNCGDATVTSTSPLRYLPNQNGKQANRKG